MPNLNPNRFHPPKHIPPTLNLMIGVAGHIDHGKTELVKMLTGCDTDRLKEEKERGMSIELGYAPCYLEGGRVGIVDVPGHEKFVRKMVAGVTGIDIALLVIAADDGIMPQTREHFDIIELLGIQHLLIAISKIDLVSAERVQRVETEIREFLISTMYAHADMIPVSSVTGDGLDQLRKKMGEILSMVQRRKTGGLFRLPIDRVFSSPGHGVVVTGIAASGTVKPGDMVDILPLGKNARVRSLQVFLGNAETGAAGQCLALNLTNVRQEELERGFVVAAAGRFESYNSFTLQLRVSRFLDKPITNATKIHFHTGTLEMPGKLRLLENDEITSGQETFAQIFLEHSAPAFLRDRFILRLESPTYTVAGGVILGCGSKSLKRNHAPTLEQLYIRRQALLSSSAFLLALMEETAFQPRSVDELAQLAGITQDEVRESLEHNLHEGKIIQSKENSYLSILGFQLATEMLYETLISLHQKHPQRFSFPIAEIHQELPQMNSILEFVLKRLCEEKRVLVQGEGYRAVEAKPIDAKMAAFATQIESILREERFQTSSPQQLAEKLHLPLDQVETALRYLTEMERIRRLTDTVYLHDEQVQWAKRELTEAIRRSGSFETHLFKNLIQSSRKYAIPLLDYFDAMGITRRMGDRRYLCETKVTTNDSHVPSPQKNP